MTQQIHGIRDWVRDALKSVVVAASPGVVWTAVGVPFDVIRVRLQTTSTLQFRGPWHCLTQTVRVEGVQALWKGFTPQLLISLPYSAIMFGTYRSLRPADPPPGSARAEWRRFYGGVFAAGFASGVALTALQNPLDVWRTRLQTTYTPASQRGAEARGSLPALRALMDGPDKWRLLFRGTSMTAARNMPGNGIFFVSHEYLLLLFDQPTALQRLWCGATTGVIFNLALYPCDAVRARLMVSSPADGGVRVMAANIIREHGLAGFYRGSLVMLARAVPVNAAGFWTLHAVQSLLGDA